MGPWGAEGLEGGNSAARMLQWRPLETAQCVANGPARENKML